MKRKKFILQKILRQKDGNTMVSVLVGFLLLLMTFAMLQQVVSYTYTMMARAREIREQTDELTGEYYTGQTTNSQKADILVNDKKKFSVVNENDANDKFSFSFDLNSQYTDEMTVFYFGEHEVVTGGD